MKTYLIGKRKAVSNWLRQFMTVIDPIQGLYKIQESLLYIFKWGEFKRLPKIDYVLVFRQLFAKCESCPVDEIEKDNASFFQVSLVYDKNKRIIFHETRSREDAFIQAKTLAAQLQSRVMDSTNRNGIKSWLT
ncbi:MAG: hypothetical protein IPM51_00880 [Sphingobacteriaceae bacterium]|nr:hypothetical protein [Sphingobacteriaceae bacterium]